MSLLLIAIFTFLAAVSLIVIIFMLPMAVQNTPHARITKRLTAIGHMSYASRAEIQSLLKSSVYSEVPWLNAWLSRFRLLRHIDLLLERANLDITPGMFLFASVDAFALTLFLVSLLGKPFRVALLIGLLAAICPYVYVKFITWKRLRKFLEQMPDGLDMISQGLQAGQGLTQAMVYVSRELPDPLGTEFSVLIEEVNLGLPLPDALRKLEQRISLPEVRLLNTALLVQREVGGSLAELLTKLADIIRDRFRIERLIKSLTAQNRMTAWVVCSVPPLLGFFMFMKEPVLMNEMLAHPVGKMMLITALGLEIAGILSFKYLIKIRI
jgi:tight adherence protein B